MKGRKVDSRFFDEAIDSVSSVLDRIGKAQADIERVKMEFLRVEGELISLRDELARRAGRRPAAVYDFQPH